MSYPPETPTYSQIACIGTGLSAIALGATLQRWYKFDDICFFDRHSESGGTWHINSYPGCACDVPGALYSYSFELNPNWTKVMPSRDEIKQYHHDVLNKYCLRDKIRHSVEVIKCIWMEEADRWVLYMRDVNTTELYTHECQILFAATGRLVEPRPCEIVGAETFHGSIFHSARWNHGVELEGKDVIVIGNGCSATQIVPAIVGKVKSLTQIIRSQQWVFPAANFEYGPFLQWAFRHVPFAMRLYRLRLFIRAEKDLRLFPMTKAAAELRQECRIQVDGYMRAVAPGKYHGILIPDFDVGCKRRVFDCGYLQSLNNDNVALTNAKIERILPEGIETDQGLIPADVIVLATGFRTNQFVSSIDVIGRDGRTLTEHWSQYGGPAAYNCSAVNRFPNFFMLSGPNAATGHTSALMAIENSVNYALRILKPVLEGTVSAVEIKEEAEQVYVHQVQEALSKQVWSVGCVSWYKNDRGWNSMTYPWTQGHYWWRSLFPTWSDWDFKVSACTEREYRSTDQLLKRAKGTKRTRMWFRPLSILLLGGGLLGGLMYGATFKRVPESYFSICSTISCESTNSYGRLLMF
ncbi:flavin-containing monooxygenase [Aspergillus ibericus CBS 121593]|uniref:L-ornithine N(5)-monooxygenase n=1 Tax=Aspergillus ibericus CBS 121593 TaxID=1448316 RepID=A0A395HGQ8_9EURO|nr:FAD/NAD(P)-binding domain-containing protein [Aspergillus ibericus CBS 121593]RAL05414.1 FAD/NAD(P)-binding domain-containing protein [Aspergillus ibericus CBS 121593]